jgi:hypothetical protein
MVEYLKRVKDHNPSLRVEDIRLSRGQYLIAGPVVSDSGSMEFEEDRKLWVPITKEMKFVNVSKVLKRGDGCTLAEVGEYVVFSSITGESFNHLKPQPVIRNHFDDGGLYTLDEQNVRAVIPEAVVEQKKREVDGTSICCEKGRPREAADG